MFDSSTYLQAEEYGAIEIITGPNVRNARNACLCFLPCILLSSWAATIPAGAWRKVQPSMIPFDGGLMAAAVVMHKIVSPCNFLVPWFYTHACIEKLAHANTACLGSKLFKRKPWYLHDDLGFYRSTALFCLPKWMQRIKLFCWPLISGLTSLLLSTFF